MLYIRAWASVLLVQLRWAMRRPPNVGRVTIKIPTLFHKMCILKNNNCFRYGSLSDLNLLCAMSVGVYLSDKREMFDDPLSFKGRARRSEYWLSFFLSILTIPLLAFNGFNMKGENARLVSTLAIIGMLSPFLMLFVYASFLPSFIAYILAFIGGVGACFDYVASWWFLLAQGAKRCHDLGHSGWFQIIPFYVLAMLFCEGQKDENDYGLSPKFRNLAA